MTFQHCLEFELDYTKHLIDNTRCIKCENFLNYLHYVCLCFNISFNDLQEEAKRSLGRRSLQLARASASSNSGSYEEEEEKKEMSTVAPRTPVDSPKKARPELHRLASSREQNAAHPKRARNDAGSEDTECKSCHTISKYAGGLVQENEILKDQIKILEQQLSVCKEHTYVTFIVATILMPSTLEVTLTYSNCVK